MVSEAQVKTNTMKNYITTKWGNLKNWFFHKIIVKIFDNQITSSILIVNEDGTLPYTVTKDFVILTLNGGGKIQINKDRFWENVRQLFAGDKNTEEYNPEIEAGK